MCLGHVPQPTWEMPMLLRGGHWKDSQFAGLSSQRQRKMRACKEAKGNQKLSPRNAIQARRAVRISAVGEGLRQPFPHPERQSFAPKIASPINPALSSSLLTYIKCRKAAGYNIGLFVNSCSEDCKHCGAFNFIHPKGTKAGVTCLQGQNPQE